MMDTLMRRASHNIGNLLGYSHKSEDSQGGGIGTGMDVSGHSAGGGSANGSTPTSPTRLQKSNKTEMMTGKSTKSEITKSTKSVLGQVPEHGHGQSSKTIHSHGEENDDDDPIIASNIYSDNPQETASIGGMITSFMKNGFSSMVGSTVGSGTNKQPNNTQQLT